MAANTSGKTFSIRTGKLRAWITRNYGSKPVTYLTSEMAANAASVALGFVVSPNRVAREMYRQGISFKVTEEDPPQPAWSKTELNRVRIDQLEERIRVIELKLFGEAKSTFTPRSRRELQKMMRTEAAAE